MSALALIPAAQWLRLGLLLLGVLVSLGLLWWLVSRRRPSSQREVVAAFASEDPAFFADFAADIGQVAIRFFCGMQRCLCRVDDPRLDAKQQALFAQCRSDFEALGFAFVGFLVPCSALQGVRRVDEPTVLFVLLEQEGRISAAVTCQGDTLTQTELESEGLDGSILGTVMAQGNASALLDSPPTVHREFVSIGTAEALLLHRSRMATPGDFRTFENLDDIVASQRRQEAQRIRHTLSKGAPGFEGIGQLVSQQVPWYWLRSARDELAQQVDRHMLGWRAKPAEMDEAARIVAAVPYTVGLHGEPDAA
jgi:hypothetical protein